MIITACKKGVPNLPSCSSWSILIHIRGPSARRDAAGRMADGAASRAAEPGSGSDSSAKSASDAFFLPPVFPFFADAAATADEAAAAAEAVAGRGEYDEDEEDEVGFEGRAVGAMTRDKRHCETKGMR